MAKTFKKLNKTFLTLLLMIGVFFAGLAGISPAISTASAVSNYYKWDTSYFVPESGAERIYSLMMSNGQLMVVDNNGFVYISEDGKSANLEKNGARITRTSNFDIPDANTLYSNYSENFFGASPLGTGLCDRGINLIAEQNGIILVIACDEQGIFTATSTDNGTSWIIREMGGIGGDVPVSLVAGNGYFVSMVKCATEGKGNGSGLIAWSSNAIDWRYIELNNYASPTLTFTHNAFYYADVTYSQGSSYIYRFDDPSKISDSASWHDCVAIFEKTTTHIPCIAEINGAVVISADTSLYFLYDSGFLTEVSIDENLQELLTQPITEMQSYNNGVLLFSGGKVIYTEISSKMKTSNSKLILDNNDELFVNNGISPNFQFMTKSTENVCLISSGIINTSSTSQPVVITLERSEYCTVTFKDWNNNTITTTEVEIGTTASAPSNPSRTGYTFVGWDRDLTEPITEDTVINAVYQINQHNVYFKDYNGQAIKTIKVNYGDTINPEEIPTPARDGYSFAGWDKDITNPITTDVSFIAQYTRDLTLTINYLEPAGKIGTVKQFIAMQPATKVFNYTYGDEIATEELNSWYQNNILAWENDFAEDNVWDYQYKLNGWDKTLPSTIINNLTVSAVYERLNTVTLVYYSQLRFLAGQKDDVDYYYTFIGYMTIDRLMVTGETVNLENFKKDGVNYNIYNASRNTFYNNLEYFEFLGWDRDLSDPITEDTVITGDYKLPTIESRLFDGDGYYLGATQQKINFMTIEDMQALEGSSSTWSKIREGFRLFFTLQWGDFGALIADQIDLSDYLESLGKYHDASCQLLTAFVCVDTDYPEYGGIFKNGLVATSSPVLQYYTGTANENNMSFWINPIVFATDLYKLTVTVNYSNILTSAVKTLTGVFEWAGTIVSDYWWLIVLVVLIIIFRKPLIAGLTLLFKAIGSGVKSLSNKAKKSKVNSEYKKAEKEYTAVKKESKHKE